MTFARFRRRPSRLGLPRAITPRQPGNEPLSGGHLRYHSLGVGLKP
jgi:hypothetical protein